MVNGNKKSFWIATIIILALDQIFKFIINEIQPRSAFLHLVQNTGAGFGILKGHTFWLAIISMIVVVVVMFQYKKIPAQPFPQLLWGLFLGGVLGNLIDRVLRGYVIDFIDLQVWPAFNIADAAITISVLGLLYIYWKEEDDQR